MIRILTINDWPVVSALIETTRNLQGNPRSDDSKQYVLDYMHKRLGWRDNVFFGSFSDDGVLLSFVRFNYWLHDDGINYTMGAIYVTNQRTLLRTKSPYWTNVSIELVDHAITDFENRGYTKVWTARLDSPTWSPIVTVCKLKDYTSTVMESVAASALPATQLYFNVMNFPMPSPQLIVKLERPNEATPE